MLAELYRNKAAHERGEAEDLGLLSAVTLMGGSGPWVVQYWKSIEHLYAYARMTSAEHLPAWKAFNTAARRHPGAVGIWHETYAVPATGEPVQQQPVHRVVEQDDLPGTSRYGGSNVGRVRPANMSVCP